MLNLSLKFGVCGLIFNKMAFWVYNGVALKRHKKIASMNVDKDISCHMALLDLSELKQLLWLYTQ